MITSRQSHSSDTVIHIKDVKLGNGHFELIAGPCAIESFDQLELVGMTLHNLGIRCIRGGAFKPRTSPYSFQGLGEKGIHLLKEVSEKYNLVSFSEVMDADQVDMMSEMVDVLQVGARNMQNFSLLKRLGKTRNPVLLKRGMSATYEEFLLSAEYILSGGNHRVILCERGIRTFETFTKNTFDVGSIPILKELSHLPVIADPSHAVGIRRFVAPLAKAALVVGADGVMVEVHPNPVQALSDPHQALDLNELKILCDELFFLRHGLLATHS